VLRETIASKTDDGKWVTCKPSRLSATPCEPPNETSPAPCPSCHPEEDLPFPTIMMDIPECSSCSSNYIEIDNTQPRSLQVETSAPDKAVDDVNPMHDTSIAQLASCQSKSLDIRM
jgi:hypothetical protein